jgi:hypothetical protein
MSAVDPFYGARQPRGPAHNAFPITPEDNLPLPVPTSALYVGGTGNVTVYLQADPTFGSNQITGAAAAPVTFSNVPAGTVLNISAKVVMATGTTATNLVGLV